MHKIGVNANQLARLANPSGSVTPEEIKELKGMIKEIIIINGENSFKYYSALFHILLIIGGIIWKLYIATLITLQK